LVRPARIEKVLDGIVVRMTNYGESDRIVEFLTAEEGRVSMIARGARRSRKRFGGALDLFAGLRTHAQPSSNLWTLKSVDPLNLRLELRLNFDLLARASLICDCARVLTPEHHESSDMYGAVRGGLDLLIAGDAVAASQAYPLILQSAGILPDTSQVRLETGKRYGLDFRSGMIGMLGQVRTAGRGFSAEVVHALRGETCTTAEGARELERLVVDWIQHQIGKRLASADVYLDLM
jgi:DNA repair protein RecO (recombination protein O)